MITAKCTDSQKTFFEISSNEIVQLKSLDKPRLFLFVLALILLTNVKSTLAQDSLRLAFNDHFQNRGSVQELQMLIEKNISRDNSFANYDTTFAVIKPKLLPKNISFAENFLWGENGFFRKVGIASTLTPDVRRHELKVRRAMLTAHQIGGFSTLGLMLASVYYGQIVIDGCRDLGNVHKRLVAFTIGSYSLTGLLAILSPPPLIRRDGETSTTTIHKTLAWVHVLGMIVTPILGSLISGHRSFNIDKAHVHQIAGYLTTAVFAASLIVVTF